MKTTRPAAQPHVSALRVSALRGAPRGGVDVASELRRLRPRDRWLIELLAEHQVLTTEQIAALGFDHVHTARHRLVLLQRRGVLARFGDGARPDSGQWRWTLDLVGANYIAARRDQPTPKPAAVRYRINRLAANPNLGHLLGVNGVFVDLAAHARHTPGAALGTWWSGRTCRSVVGDLVHPDGHGVWTDAGRSVGFWLEYDTGEGEPMRRVVSKLDGYARLHRATGLDHTVLFWVATPGREASLRRHLGAHPAITGGTLPVATANGAHDANPAAPVWLPAGRDGARVRLADLGAPAQELAA